MSLDRRLIDQTVSSRGYLILAVVLGWTGGIFTILQAGTLSRVVTAFFLEGKTINDLLHWLGVLLAFFAGRSILQLGGEMAGHLASTRIRSGIRRILLEHILSLGPAYSQGEQTGEQVTAAVQGVDSLDAYFSQYLPQVALAALIPLTILLATFPMDWLSGLILLLTAPLIPLFMVLIGQASAAATRKQFTTLGRLSAFLLDAIQGLVTLKLLNQSKAQASRLDQVSERYRMVTMSVLRIAFLSALVLELVGTLSTAVIAVQIGLRLLEGSLVFEKAFFILLLAPEFYLPLRLLGLRFHAAETGRAAAARIFEVLSMPLIQQTVPPDRFPEELSAVEFDHVGFIYPERAEAALDDVTFSLQPGSVTAVVGASGVGKSTLVHLLLGFIRPQKGMIKVNGIDLARFSIQEWRTKVGWLPQSPHIFHGSIAENMRIAKTTASDMEVLQAAQRAYLDHTIRNLPQGYQTVVGEGGQVLSGGESQRLALARTFLADAPILIVDEPTVGLDPELEDALNETFSALRRSQTILLIAHRRKTVMLADRVVVLEGGRVVEQGSPHELLIRGGAFFRLVGRGEDLA